MCHWVTFGQSRLPFKSTITVMNIHSQSQAKTKGTLKTKLPSKYNPHEIQVKENVRHRVSAQTEHSSGIREPAWQLRTSADLLFIRAGSEVYPACLIHFRRYCALQPEGGKDGWIRGRSGNKTRIRSWLFQ